MTRRGERTIEGIEREEELKKKELQKKGIASRGRIEGEGKEGR